MENIKQLRNKYTKIPFSNNFTKELLMNLYNFIMLPMVKEKEWFSEYDKAGLICAIEKINELEILLNEKDK